MVLGTALIGQLLPLARYLLARFFPVPYTRIGGRRAGPRDEIVGQWRNERPDLDVAPLALYGRLFRVVHLSDEALARGLSQHGLQTGWFNLLAALRRAGAAGPRNSTQLVHATLVSSSGMTKPLDRTEADVRMERRP